MAHSATTLQTAPAIEPISLAEAKAHLRVTHTSEDSLIERQITLAREYVEATTHRQLITATWDLYLDAFPAIIYPPYPPLQSVTHLKYYDNSNTLTTLTEDTDFEVDTDSDPGRIQEYYGTSWPTTRDRFNAVNLRYVAGYGTAATDVPENFRQALLLLLAHWYETREVLIPGTISSEAAFSVMALLNLDPAWEF